MAKKKTFQLHNIFFFFSACCVKYTFFVFKMKDWISKFAYQKKKTRSVKRSVHCRKEQQEASIKRDLILINNTISQW